jgi:hypothetical protein
MGRRRKKNRLKIHINANKGLVLETEHNSSLNVNKLKI